MIVQSEAYKSICLSSPTSSSIKYKCIDVDEYIWDYKDNTGSWNQKPSNEYSYVLCLKLVRGVGTIETAQGPM